MKQKSVRIMDIIYMVMGMCICIGLFIMIFGHIERMDKEQVEECHGLGGEVTQPLDALGGRGCCVNGNLIQRVELVDGFRYNIVGTCIEGVDLK